MFWLWLFIFGVAVGVVSGLLGIGGGVLLVPGLMLLFRFSQAEAQGSSLAVLIPPIGIFAALVYYQHGYVRLPVVGFIALGFMVGAYVGARFVPHLSPEFLRVAFGMLLLYLGFSFVFNPRGSQSAMALPSGIATLAVLVIARLFRRGAPPTKTLPPPGGDQNYHI